MTTHSMTMNATQRVESSFSLIDNFTDSGEYPFPPLSNSTWYMYWYWNPPFFPSFGFGFEPEETHTFGYRSSWQVTVRFFIVGVGFAGNVIILVTFLRMGLKDSMSIGFFNLAVSDILLLISQVMYLVWLTNTVNYSQRLYEGLDDCSRNVTALLTTFLAIQRCLCVLLPFRFKDVFTKWRTYAIVTILWTYWSIIGASAEISYRLRTKGGLLYHVRYILVRERLSEIEKGLTLTTNLVIRPLCIVVLIACLFIMAFVLQRSVRFRQKALNVTRIDSRASNDKGKVTTPIDSRASNDKGKVTTPIDSRASNDKGKVTTPIDSQASNDKGKVTTPIDSQASNDKGKVTTPIDSLASNDKGKVKKPKKGRKRTKAVSAGSKERQAIVQVTLVSVVFIMSSIYDVYENGVEQVTTVKLGMGFDIFIGDFALLNILDWFVLLNSTINFFIFYKFNTRFRQLCFKRTK